MCRQASRMFQCRVGERRWQQVGVGAGVGGGVCGWCVGGVVRVATSRHAGTDSRVGGGGRKCMGAARRAAVVVVALCHVCKGRKVAEFHGIWLPGGGGVEGGYWAVPMSGGSSNVSTTRQLRVCRHAYVHQAHGEVERPLPGRYHRPNAQRGVRGQLHTPIHATSSRNDVTRGAACLRKVYVLEGRAWDVTCPVHEGMPCKPREAGAACVCAARAALRQGVRANSQVVGKGGLTRPRHKRGI